MYCFIFIQIKDKINKTKNVKNNQMNETKLWEMIDF